MVPPSDATDGSSLGEIFGLSDDLGTVLWPQSTAGQRLRNEVQWVLSHLDGSRTEASGLLQPIAQQGNSGDAAQYTYWGGAADLSTFAFTEEPNAVIKLLPEEPLVSQGFSNLYEISGAGGTSPVLHIVNLGIGGACGAGLGGKLGAQPAVERNAISADGSVTYFSAVPGAPPAGEGSCNTSSGKRLFKRVNNETTVEVSASQCAPTPTCPGSPGGDDNFMGASGDGSVAFFTTSRRLTNSDTDNTVDLYAYDSKLSPSERLIQASAGQTIAGHTAGSGAEVLGVLANSSDGSRVYFVAKGLLAGANLQGKAPTAGQPNLYVFERDATHPAGRLAFIATLDPTERKDSNSNPLGDPTLWAVGNAGVGSESIALPNEGAERNGRFLLFSSFAQLTAEDTDHAKDLYRYDDSASDPSKQLVCLTCSGSGEFDIAVGAVTKTSGSPSDSLSIFRPASADLSIVAFETAEQLLPADENSGPNHDCTAGSKNVLGCDVYAWEALGSNGCSESTSTPTRAYFAADSGCLALISDGTEGLGIGGGSPRMAGVSPDGRDVFFITRSPLVAADGNNSLDLYDARVGGGFPAQPEAMPCGDEGSCHGALEPEPSAASPASADFSGAGNRVASPGLPTATCPKGRVKRHGKCVAKHSSGGGKRHRKGAKRHRKGGERR